MLEIALNYGGAEFAQEIVVAEEHDFRVVTHSAGLRWTIEGHIGRIIDGVAPITLSYGAYDSPTSDTRGLPSPRELTVDDCGAGGGGDFHLMVERLWLRRGIDAVPVLARSIAARRKNFESAVWRLGRFGPKAKPAVAELVGLLKDAAIDHGRKPYESIRNAAADSLGKIGPGASDAAPALLQAMHDENPYLRLEASLALWKIAAHPDAVPIAIKELSNENHLVRYQAARTLQAIGQGAKAAVPALTAALEDTDGYMRAGAAWALWAIRRDLSENSSNRRLRRLAKHALQRQAAGYRPDPLPASAVN